MDEINDGGPAFPVHPEVDLGWEHAGMSLRDFFAAKALPSCVRQCVNDTRNHGETIEQLFARKAYEIADAMLKARG